MPESYKEDGRPAQQWYWDDWFAAFDVRLCSLAARGLWIDMLGIMFKAEIRGTLTINGRQINTKILSKIVGVKEEIITKLLRELERNDVFSKLDDSTIICRRMFRESSKKGKISKIRSEAGKKGMESRWEKNDIKPITKENNKKITKITTSISTSTSIPTSKTSCSEKHSELAVLLEAKIKERMPRHRFTGKQHLEKWANEFRLMEEKEEATPEEIEKLVIWVSKNDFWYKNIRSAEKLRKQFGRLWAEMEDEVKKGGKRAETPKEFTRRQKKALQGK